MCFRFFNREFNFTGSVHWAFASGESARLAFKERIAATNPDGPFLPPDIVKVETCVITYYCRATARLDHSGFDYFVYG